MHQNLSINDTASRFQFFFLQYQTLGNSNWTLCFHKYNLRERGKFLWQQQKHDWTWHKPSLSYKVQCFFSVAWFLYSFASVFFVFFCPHPFTWQHMEFQGQGQIQAIAATYAISFNPLCQAQGSNLRPGTAEMPPIPLCHSGNSCFCFLWGRQHHPNSRLMLWSTF